MTNSKNATYDKIVDFLSSEKSIAENEIFMQWIQQSEDRLQAYQQIKKFWQTDQTLSQAELDKKWGRFQRALDERNLSNFKKHLFQISVAASLLILIAAGWFLNKSTEKMVTLSTNENTFRKDTLEDGSIIYLYPSSALRINKKTKFKLNKEMNLIGDAFFVVAETDGNEMVINVGEASIKVKGTSFRVNALPNGEISVMVESGAVEFSSVKTEGNPLIVQAGEQGYYSPERQQIWKQGKTDNIYLIYQPTHAH